MLSCSMPKVKGFSSKNNFFAFCSSLSLFLPLNVLIQQKLPRVDLVVLFPLFMSEFSKYVS